MNGSKNGMSCQTGCWALAAGVGFVAFVLMLVVGSYGLIGSIFLGGLAFVVLGFLFSMIFCSPLTKPGEVPNPGPGTGVPVSTETHPAASHGRTSASGAATASGHAVAASAATASDPAITSAHSTETAPATAAAARTSAPTAETAASEPETAAQGGPAAAETQAAAAPPAPGAAVADADAEAGGSVKPSKDLPGQRDLESRKGTWNYGGNGAAQEAKPSAGTQPALLDAPREGGKDDLKKINGVGPKLEEQINGMGIYHFDQIAAWTEAEIAWVDDNLDGFKGRVTRDDWVGQAKTLSGRT